MGLAVHAAGAAAACITLHAARSAARDAAASIEAGADSARMTALHA